MTSENMWRITMAFRVCKCNHRVAVGCRAHVTGMVAAVVQLVQ